MKIRLPAAIVVVLVALIVTAPLGLPAVAMPGAETGAVFGTKAAKEAEKAAREAAAEAEKQVRKCRAEGTLPCAPTVTLTWEPFVAPTICYAIVSVTGFAPGPHDVTMHNPSHTVNVGTLHVGPDGTGSFSSVSTRIALGGGGYVATVRDIQSVPSTTFCPTP